MRNLSRGLLLLSIFTWLAIAGIFWADFVLASEKIDINTAPLEDLLKIIHVGEVRGKELISLRPFSSLDELTKIKGISEKRVEDIKNQGLAWVGNSQSQLESGTEPETQIPEEEQIKLEPITYPSGILINELIPSPEGEDKLEEWIELKNLNENAVNLSGWKIQDTIGSVTSYTFPEETKIPARGFLVFTRPATKITLNNDGDSLKLIQPNGNIIDRVTYEKALLGQSYNRTDSGWIWNSTLTPGLPNNIPISISQPEEEIQEEKEQESIGERERAAIGEQIPKSSNSFYIFLIALGLAVFSGGIIILFLKNKLTIDFKEKLK
jgi:hypothetical protein